jgi:predicted pyridoxine 5'-phosphate oxidase superfamily flavin-nucleotide-binding protein
LQIIAHLNPDDPVAPFFMPGASVEVLGIDPATRRRNRANGMLRSIGDHCLTVAVAQSFGNCPQCIQTRFWHEAVGEPGSVERLTELDAAARAILAAADTFFVASSSGSGAGAPDGVDISHRGGRPGFIAVDGNILTIPDFHGNGYFNTFGNLLLNPQAGLLFVDWSTGSVLHLTGRVDILWNETRDFAGAERLWRVSIDSAWRRSAALICAGHLAVSRGRSRGQARGRRRVWLRKRSVESELLADQRCQNRRGQRGLSPGCEFRCGRGGLPMVCRWRGSAVGLDRTNSTRSTYGTNRHGICPCTNLYETGLC